MARLHLWTTRQARSTRSEPARPVQARFAVLRARFYARLGFSAQLLRLAAVLALAAALSACATARPSYDMVVTAQAVKPSWDPAGHARLQAREEAVARARQMLWDAILREKVAVPGSGAGVGEVTVEHLVATNPAFESSLWAMIGRLQPTRVEDLPDGELVVQLETDRREALALASDYATRMRREGRL